MTDKNESANLQFIGFSDEVVDAVAGVCVSDRKPQFSVVQDATVTRFDHSCTIAEFPVDGFRHSYKRIVQGGVFDSEGNLCNLSRHRRVRGYPTDFPSHLCELPENEQVPEASMSRAVYGGVLQTPHYGHFLIDGLARGAALLDSPELPILFLWDGKGDTAGMAVTAFQAAGLDPARLVFVSRPLRVGELYLPEQSLCSQEGALAPQAELFDRIAGDSPPATRHLYVSRRLHDVCNPTRYRYVNEADLEERYRKAGFEIVYPELLSMIEQARLFRSAALCVGLVGSAMHNVVFCRPGTRVVYINHESHLNFTYPLIDKLKGINSTYIQATPPDVVGHEDSRFWSLQEMGVIQTLSDANVLPRPLGAAAAADGWVARCDEFNVDLLMRLSRLLLEGSSDSERLNALKELQGTFGENPRLLYQLFRVCERSRDWNGAIEYLWKLCGLVGRLPVLLRKIAASHAALGNFEAACRFAVEWADSYPHDTLAHNFVSHYQEKCGRLGEARAAADRALAANPYNHNALCRAGRLRMHEDPLRAAADLERAAGLWPSSFEPNFHASKCKASLGELEAALSYATRAVELKPDHPGAQKYLKALQNRRNAS